MDARALVTLGDMPPWLPWTLVGTGLALLASAIYGVTRQARLRRGALVNASEPASSTKPPRTGKAVPASAQTNGSAQDARAMMVEIKQLVDAAAAELDRKADRLERLIRAADERISRMDTAGERGDGGLGRAIRADREARGASVADAVPTSAELAKAELDADPLTVEIHRLADAGMSAVKIAQKLGQNIGTVELILALRA